MKKKFTNLCRRSTRSRFGSMLFAGLLFAGAMAQAQQTYTFTNAAATGSLGPSQAQVNTAYLATNLNGAVTVNSVGVQSWTVPQTMGYRITALGAQGGVSWGLGASMAGDFTLTAGTVLRIVVGQQGGSNNSSHGSGGGGSFVAITGATVPLVVAGGGGGRGANSTAVQAFSNGTVVTAGGSPGGGFAPGGTNGGGGGAGSATTGGTQTTPGGNSAGSDWASGGGGFYTDGGACNAGNTPGGRNFLTSNSVGGNTSTSGGLAPGGFGGGGGCGDRGAGAGGYSGGGAGTNNSDGGGGGGSFNAGINQTNSSGVNTGHGRVIIQELCFISLTASGTNSLAPSLCAGNSLTLSTNATTYTWSTGNSTNNNIVVSPTSTQIYSVVGTSSNNCAASNIITVTVNGSVPSLAIANPSANICLGRTVSVTATGAITYTWTGGITNGVPFTPNATTIYTVSGQNGCGISTATTAINVAPLPVTALTTSTLLCQGYPATLTAQSAVNGYSWQPTAGTGSLVVVAPFSNTIYTVTASDGTCSGTATVGIQTQTTPTIATSASNGTICQGLSTNLSATGAGIGGTYSWSPGGGTGSSISVAPSTNSLYTVVGTNSLGCAASAQQIVLVNSAPILSISPASAVVCAGTPVALNASGGTNYVWTGGPSTAGFTVTPTATAIYTVSAQSTTNQCIGTKTVQVQAVVPNVSVSSNTAVCIGGSVTLTASGATTYSWNGTPIASGILAVTPATTSNYVLVARTTSLNINCLSSFTVTVTVNALPTVSATSTKSLTCRNQTNTLTATGASTYSWSNNTTGNTTTVNPSTTTFYTVTGTDANGCSNSTIFQAKVSNCAGITDVNAKALVAVYPNPNNGDFTISTSTDMELRVINTIGQEVAAVKLTDANAHQVKLTGLSAGVYFVTGNNGSEQVLEKIVIDK